MRKKESAVDIVFGIFAFVGIIFVISGILWMISGIRFRENAAEVMAVITEIDTYRDSDGDTNHRVYVNYSYGGNTYNDIPLGEYSSGMYEGKEIELLVDPQKPGRISTAFGNIFGPSMFIGMGAIFAAVGICPIVFKIRKKAQNKKLIAAGRSIFATVDSIDVNTSYAVNGRHPYVIYCSYRDEYKDILDRFKSENLWTDPSRVIQPGSEIRIYVDGTNFSKYYVDTESLLDGKIIDYT